MKHLYARKHETENLIGMCHSPRRLFLVISAMICVRLREDGPHVGADIDFLAERLNSFANDQLRLLVDDDASVKGIIELLDLPARIEGELNALGFTRIVFLRARDRCPQVRECLRRFSGLTGFHFVFEG